MTEPWLLAVPLQNTAVCRHAALLLCLTARGADPGAATPVLRALESSTWGHHMSKGASEPWVLGGDSPWPYTVPVAL